MRRSAAVLLAAWHASPRLLCTWRGEVRRFCPLRLPKRRNRRSLKGRSAARSDGRSQPCPGMSAALPSEGALLCDFPAVGRALAELRAQGVQRSELFISTKAGYPPGGGAVPTVGMSQPGTCCVALPTAWARHLLWLADAASRVCCKAYNPCHSLRRQIDTLPVQRGCWRRPCLAATFRSLTWRAAPTACTPPSFSSRSTAPWVSLFCSC